MPIVVIECRLRKKRGAEVSDGGYDVALLGRAAGESEREFGVKPGASLGPERDFRLDMSVPRINATSIRLRVRRAGEESSAFTRYQRLVFDPGSFPQRVSLGDIDVADERWRISGELARNQAFDAPLGSLRVLLRVVSGAASEEPATVAVSEDGGFAFEGRRLLLNPEKQAELRVIVRDAGGAEVARFYRMTEGTTVDDCSVRLGVPLLNVWKDFVASHPALARRLRQFDFEPKAAHEGMDTFYVFRRYQKLAVAQIGEGHVGRAKKGPVGDPDWVWDVALDPLYDSDSGFRLPNERNRRKHGHGRPHGIHVEACRSLSRELLPDDGLIADADTVPGGVRVWMLGTHVFDDAWDFGSPDHEHNELHPLYVMQSCMGGWFHFAVRESIAVAAAAREAAEDADAGIPDDGWPRTSEDPADYHSAYVELDPVSCLNALHSTYRLIVEFYRDGGQTKSLVAFYAATGVRYAAHGVDFGGHMNAVLEPPHRDHARSRIEADQASLLVDDLFVRLEELYDFLYGPPSYAASPVSGPAPNSYLRCAFAVDGLWAAQATDGAVGEGNPRIGLNRAGSRQLEKLRLEHGRIYRDLFKHVQDPDERERLFVEAVQRYRHWAVPPTDRLTEEMDVEALREVAAERNANQVAGELRVRVNSFYEALSPHVRV